MNNKKVLLDTGVIISFCGRSGFFERETTAKELINYLKSNNFEIFYSQRTLNELNKKPSIQRNVILSQLKLAGYYYGNETIDQIEGAWGNISSLWNNSVNGELELANRVKGWLTKEKDLRDRGILLDAIMNQCSFFVHENPNDFSKIPAAFLKEFDLRCINLLICQKTSFPQLFAD